MNRKHAFRWAFLTVTAVAIGLELWASFDSSDATEPWTDLIVQFVPGEVTAVAIGGLSLWLITHFGLRYWRKHKSQKEK